MADIAHHDSHPGPGNGDGAEIPQPYHLVRPSPWPLMGALSGGLLAFGAIEFMHYKTSIFLWLGLLAVLSTMALWWRDVIHEAVVEKAHSAVVKIGLRYGMALFIASEVMFFAAFFWAFYDAWLFPKAYELNPQGVWPPPHIKTFDPFHFPFTMTLVLLLSGTTVTWAHHAILEGNNKDAAKALGITVLLGLLFTGLQAYEYSHAAFGFKEGIYPSSFFMATGFHGLHVIIGTIFLAVCWARTVKGHFTADSHFGFEAAAWYWHFVDVVWLFLFVSIYWFGS